MCQTVLQDDPTILADERLFRRVHLSQIVKDENTGQARISSGAFRDKELSINIEPVLLSSNQGPEACLRNHQRHKLVSITAGQSRHCQQIVCRDPLPEEPSHGLVYGSKNNRRIFEGLRDAAVWTIPPQPPAYEDVANEKKLLGIPE